MLCRCTLLEMLAIYLHSRQCVLYKFAAACLGALRDGEHGHVMYTGFVFSDRFIFLPAYKGHQSQWAPHVDKLIPIKTHVCVHHTPQVDRINLIKSIRVDNREHAEAARWTEKTLKSFGSTR